MGVCFSAQVKAAGSSDDYPHTSSVSIPKYEGTDAGETDSISSNMFSVTPTLRSEGEILQASILKTFTYADLKLATRNFRPDSVLGEGGFGTVFKGWVNEHTHAESKSPTGMFSAVKRLKHETLSGHREEWLAQVNFLGQLYHPNLVKLTGYCLEGDQRLLVYEFIPRGSLENHLFMRGSYFQPLSWNLRLKAALGAAKGLAFLHCPEANVILSNLKTSSILLDTNYNAKLSDFGLANDGPIDFKTNFSTTVHVSTRGMGAYGYTAPEYVATGHLNAKSNVYSFGVVLLEMISGLRAVDKNRPPRKINMVEWAKPYLANKRKVFRVVDNRLEGQYTLDAAHKAATLALKCLSTEPKFRPTMEQVVKLLEELHDPNEPSPAQIKLTGRRSADDSSHTQTATT
ncbi:unnamed protein product [Rhodiola kirilowii]